MEFTLVRNLIINTKTLTCLILGGIAAPLFSQTSGQNFTLSPYSNYGIGEWTNTNFIQSGTAAATYSGAYSYSLLNPATAGNLNYAVFDFGLSGKMGKIKAGTETQTNNLGGFNYGALAWKRELWRKTRIDSFYNDLGKKVRTKKTSVISMGNYLAIKPVTTVGYNYTFKETSPAQYFVAHSGKGGITAVELGTALKFDKYFNIGYSASYLFGQISDNSVLSIEDTTNSNYVNDVKAAYIRGWKHNIGLYKRFSTDSLHHSFGIWTQMYSGLSAYNERLTTVLGINTAGYLAVKDTVRNEITSKQKFVLPPTIGFGYKFEYKRSFAIALDYQQSDWAGTNLFFNGVQPKYSKRREYGFTFFLFPSDEKLNSERKMKTNFRFGGKYTQTQNVFVSNNVSTQVDELHFFVGSGIPIVKRYYNNDVIRSMVNVQFDYFQRGKNSNGLALEQYVGVSLGFNLGDKWFFKRKSL